VYSRFLGTYEQSVYAPSPFEGEGWGEGGVMSFSILLAAAGSYETRHLSTQTCPPVSVKRHTNQNLRYSVATQWRPFFRFGWCLIYFEVWNGIFQQVRFGYDVQHVGGDKKQAYDYATLNHFCPRWKLEIGNWELGIAIKCAKILALRA